MIQVVIHWINTLKNTTIELHVLYTLYIHTKLANWMLFTMFLKRKKKCIYYFFLLIYTCIILIIILKVDKLFQILWTKKLLPEYY